MFKKSYDKISLFTPSHCHVLWDSWFLSIESILYQIAKYWNTRCYTMQYFWTVNIAMTKIFKEYVPDIVSLSILSD